MLSRVEPSAEERFRTDTKFRSDLVAQLPMLRRYCTKLCRNVDLADDLVQETAYLALKNHHKQFDGKNLAAWLTVIALNYYRSYWRQSKRVEEDPGDKHTHRLVDSTSPHLNLILKESLQLVDRLSRDQRAVLLLLADGASYEEVAAELVLQLGTVKSKANRARELLLQGTR